MRKREMKPILSKYVGKTIISIMGEGDPAIEEECPRMRMTFADGTFLVISPWACSYCEGYGFDVAGSNCDAKVAEE